MYLIEPLLITILNTRTANTFAQKKLFSGRIDKIFPNDSLSLLQVLVNVWRAPNIFYTSIVFYILKCVLHKQHFTS